MSEAARRSNEKGFALITVVMVMAMLMTVLVAYSVVTRVDQSVSSHSIGATRGFYAAEAGLNLRAEDVRQQFLGYLRPNGVSPIETGGAVPCDGTNEGSGDFACRSYEFSSRNVITYATEDASNPTSTVVPPGEPYENLNAQVYRYAVRSVATGPHGDTEAFLDLTFDSLLVPMFQFAAFYDKDLEVHPGALMTLAGPVHSNGDVYLGSSNGLDIGGQVTTAGSLYQGRKTDSACYGGGVRVADPSVMSALPACSGSSLRLYTAADLTPWNGMVRIGVEPLTVPPPEEFDATPGSFYWDNADIRIVLDLTGGTPEIQVRDAANNVDSVSTTTLAACTGAVSLSNTFYNIREAKSIEMLEVDTELTLDCLHLNNSLMGGKGIDDATGGGLAWFLTVDGPDSGGINGYGVRLANSGTLAAGTGSPPPVRGLSVISDQAAYLHGDFNASGAVPAAVMADSINLLSAAYADGEHTFALSAPDRLATPTTINAAFLGGTDVTGGAEGPAGQNGFYNGGLENYPRLHEKWSGVTLYYRGSFVSLNAPRHVDGPFWTANVYTPPVRDWGYDVSFNDAANLPPLTPRFVYLKQDLFVRDFEK